MDANNKTSKYIDLALDTFSEIKSPATTTKQNAANYSNR